MPSPMPTPTPTPGWLHKPPYFINRRAKSTCSISFFLFLKYIIIFSEWWRRLFLITIVISASVIACLGKDPRVPQCVPAMFPFAWTLTQWIKIFNEADLCRINIGSTIAIRFNMLKSQLNRGEVVVYSQCDRSTVVVESQWDRDKTIRGLLLHHDRTAVALRSRYHNGGKIVVESQKCRGEIAVKLWNKHGRVAAEFWWDCCVSVI